MAIADSNSEDLNPPKAQRTQVPQQVPPHIVHASQSFSPPDPSRNIVSESSIHFTTSIPKFTYDLKTFLALLFEQAFDTPVSVENFPIRHLTPDCHSDINFGDKVRAEHFLAWVQANPKAKDEYGNEIDIRAAHTATPTERAMGSVLAAAFRHISSRPGYSKDNHRLQTNKRNGTLSIRNRGRAYVLLQIMLPKKNSPNIVPSAKQIDILPADFPGVSDADVKAALELAMNKLRSMTF